MAENVVFEDTKAGNKFPRAEIGLLEERYWRAPLGKCPIELLCVIRKQLLSAVPRLTEKFNPTTPGMRYFGYKVRNRDAAKNDFSKRSYGPDKAYIYIQKKNLRIDLCIDRKCEHELRKAGYKVKYSNNFQGRADWLTGWYVPHSAKNIKKVMKWLLMAFNR